MHSQHSASPKLHSRIMAQDCSSVMEPITAWRKNKTAFQRSQGWRLWEACATFSQRKYSQQIFFSFMSKMLEEIVNNNTKLNLVNVLRFLLRETLSILNIQTHQLVGHDGNYCTTYIQFALVYTILSSIRNSKLQNIFQ